MRGIVGWSLRHKSVAILAALLIIAGGAFGSARLQQELLPEVSLPLITVSTVVPGAGSEAVDENVTEPLGTAVSGIEGLDSVQGTSQQNVSAIEVEFESGTDLDAAETEIRSALDGVSLPDQAQEPAISQIATDDFPIQVVSVSADDAEAAREEANEDSYDDEELGDYSDNDLRGLTSYVQDEVIPGLQDIEGVDSVDVVGGSEPAVNVELDPQSLADNGVPAQSVLGEINGSEIESPIGSGRVAGEQRSTPILAESELSDIAALEEILIQPGGTPPSGSQDAETPSEGASPEGAPPTGAPPSGSSDGGPEPVPLGDVADVSQQNSNDSGLARTDGKPSLALSITRESDSNTVEVAEAVEEELAAVRNDMGDAEQVAVVSNDAESVSESVNDLLLKGAIGLVVSILVVMLFLRTWRATLVAAVSIPVSLAFALFLSWSFDLTLNLITMGGLVVAIGPIIDQTIVVLENAYRHLLRGEDPDEAALMGTTEVSAPVTVTVLSLAAVFLPLAFVGGIPGEIFTPLALTVTFAILAALVVALTLIPVLISLFLKRQVERGEVSSSSESGEETQEPAGHERESAIVRLYSPILSWAIRSKGAVIALAFVVFVGGLAMASQLPQIFFPAEESKTLSAQIELPEGTTLSRTGEELQTFESFLADESGVSSYLLQIGGESSAGGGGSVGGARPENLAEVTIALEDSADDQTVLDRVEEEADDIYGARNVTINTVSSTGVASNEIETTITEGTREEQERAADLIQLDMADNDDVKDVSSSIAGGAPQVSVMLDQQQAVEAGLNPETAALSLSTLFGGPQGAEQQVTLNDDPILVSIPEESLDSVEAVRELTVVPGITVGDIADVEETDSPSSVSRIDGERAVTVSGTITSQDTTAVTNDVVSNIDDLDLPDDTQVSVGGAQDDVDESFSSLFIAIGFAIVLVYLILVAYFGSVLTPLALLLSVPVATAGAFGALLLTGTPISVPALLGLLLLVGVVVANAILLVDFAEKALAAGATPDEAAIEAGKARIRPVLMTAAATIGALLPLALGIGGGTGLINQSLAIPVIGGLISSTLLTLLAVPAGYALAKNISLRARSRRGRGDGGPEGGGSDDNGSNRGPDGGPPTTEADAPEERREAQEPEPERESELVGAGSYGSQGFSDRGRNGSSGNQFELGRAQGRIEYLQQELQRRERELGDLRRGRSGGGSER